MTARILLATAVAAVGLGTLPAAFAQNVTVPNTFQADSPAIAADVNENFSVLETAINSANSGASGTSFGPAYFIPASSSADMTMRNVIVLKGNRGGGEGICNDDIYRVRVHYENTNDAQLTGASGTEMTPNQILEFGFVCADSGTTNATYQQSQIFGLSGNDPIAGFEDAVVEQSIDANGVGDFVPEPDFDYVFTSNSNPLTNSELRDSTEMWIDGNGEVVVANNATSTLSASPRPITVGALGETFQDVVIQNYVNWGNATGTRIQFRANGIGIIREINSAHIDDPSFINQVGYDAIYYRINGQTAGGLTGTPFAGGSSENQWFSH